LHVVADGATRRGVINHLPQGRRTSGILVEEDCMGIGTDKFTLVDRLELKELEILRPRPDITWFPLSPYIAGIEVTQAIQYYKAQLHLTDPNDRGPDNSVGLAAYKAAWVRVYVRSGFFNDPATLTGKLRLERKTIALPPIWSLAGEFTPQASGTVVAHQSADYPTERGSIAATLNFILPADEVRGFLRLTATIWPQGGSEAAPSDNEIIYLDGTLLQTLRVRGIFVSYNGPNASGTVANMNLSAPTVADLQSSCGQTHTVYPVEATGVFSSGGTISWSTPLTGVATNPGGCSQQWLDLNVAVAQAKANDGNRTDVLYVGLLPSGIPIANVGGCNSSGVSAVPNGQQWTMAHELGHAAGLAHGPCGTPGDANYPAYEPYDPANTPTASLGEYGLDINSGTIHPPAQKDFMSYCGPVWISLYHHNKLYNNNALDPRPTDVPYRVKLPELYDPWLWPWEYIPDPPSWELPSHFVRIQVQPVISIVGIVDLAGKLTVSSVMRVQAVPRLPAAVSTNLVAELVGANGKVAAQAPVMQTFAHGSGCGCGGGDDHGGHGSPRAGYAFQALLPDLEAGSVLRILRVDPEGGRENEEVWARKPRGEPPRVANVVARLGRQDAQLQWEAKGESAQELEFSIQYSKDKGVSWNGLAIGIREPRYRFSLREMPSGSVMFRVLAHDGFFSAHADSKPVRIKARAPIVSILHPHDGGSYQADLPLRLAAAVNTHLGARNEKLELAWFVDGKKVGSGAEVFLSGVKAGKHECRVVARDDGGESEATVTFTVARAISRESR
jgi:hypothetical protein